MYLVQFINPAVSGHDSYRHVTEIRIWLYWQQVITSGVHPRKEDEQAVNVPIGVNQLLIRDHPEAATSRDEIHCGQYGKYLKNQSRKHLAGEVLDFLEQEPSSFTRVAPFNTFKYISFLSVSL